MILNEQIMTQSAAVLFWIMFNHHQIKSDNIDHLQIDHLKVVLSYLITFSRGISNFAESQHPSVSSNFLHYHTKLHLQTEEATASMGISNILEYWLQLYVQTSSFAQSKWVSILTFPSASAFSFNLLDCRLDEDCAYYSIMATVCIYLSALDWYIFNDY